MIQNNFTPGKVRRILNEQPTEQFFDKSFQKFDAVVAEGLLTDTQRKLSFTVLLEMQKLGIPIPTDILLEKAPIPDKKGLIEAIKKQQEAEQQAAEKQQQLQMAQLQAQIDLAKSQEAANVGLRHERDSRVLSNVGLAKERRAESISDLEKATLDKIKGAKELMGIDLGSLQQFIDIVNSLRSQEEAALTTIPNKVAEGTQQTPAL